MVLGYFTVCAVIGLVVGCVTGFWVLALITGGYLFCVGLPRILHYSFINRQVDRVVRSTDRVRDAVEDGKWGFEKTSYDIRCYSDNRQVHINTLNGAVPKQRKKLPERRAFRQ